MATSADHGTPNAQAKEDHSSAIVKYSATNPADGKIYYWAECKQHPGEDGVLAIGGTRFDATQQEGLYWLTVFHLEGLL